MAETEALIPKHGGYRKLKTDLHGPPPTDTSSVPVCAGPCQSVPTSALVANAVLSLLNLCCHLLDRQLLALAETFAEEGGFTERLYRVRSERRKGSR